MIETIIVIAVAGVLALLAAPSFNDMLLMQRLRSVNAQLVTDLQFARSDGVARMQVLWMHFSSSAEQTCYTLYTSPNSSNRCECLNGLGAACTSPLTTEVRTVSIPRRLGVSVLPATGSPVVFGFDPITGALIAVPSDVTSQPVAEVGLDTAIDANRMLRVVVGRSGRPTVCSTQPDRVQVPAC